MRCPSVLQEAMGAGGAESTRATAPGRRPLRTTPERAATTSCARHRFPSGLEAPAAWAATYSWANPPGPMPEAAEADVPADGSGPDVACWAAVASRASGPHAPRHHIATVARRPAMAAEVGEPRRRRAVRRVPAAVCALRCAVNRL